MQDKLAYQCCGHCERTLEKLGANNIQIDDLWETAFLSTEQGADTGSYPYRDLKKRVDIMKQWEDLKNV